MDSVHQFSDVAGNQAHCQGERDHEVRSDSRRSRREMATNIYDREDDSKWPQKNKDGRQELEIRIGNEHISFEVR